MSNGKADAGDDEDPVMVTLEQEIQEAKPEKVAERAKTEKNKNKKERTEEQNKIVAHVKMHLKEVNKEMEKTCGPEEMEVWDKEEPELKRKEMKVAQLQAEEKPGPFGFYAKHFSSLGKLLRSTAYAFRFLAALKKGERLKTPPTLSITAEEKEKALKCWLKHLQQDEFPELLEKLKRGKTAGKDSQKFDLFLDDEGIIRHRNRLQHIGWPHAVHLPSFHRFTELWVLEIHARHGHRGVHATEFFVKQELMFHRIHQRILVILRGCLLCRRLKGQPFAAPSFAPFPAERLKLGFVGAAVGLDVAGPVLVKVSGWETDRKGRKERVDKVAKRWLLMVRCLVSKTVDVELINDQSGPSMVRGMMRLFCRLGWPETIVCDNAPQIAWATYFLSHHANEQLSPEDAGHLAEFCSTHKIRLSPIAAHAPHQGGVYERVFGTLKPLLRLSTQRRTVEEDEMRTVLSTAVMFINSTPLFPIRIDGSTGFKEGLPPHFDNTVILTPNHFSGLSGRRALTPGSHTGAADVPFRVTDVLPLHEEILKSFWEQYQQLYYSSLVKEGKYYHDSRKGAVHRTPQPDDVVILKDDGPKGTFRLGKILDVYFGKDGVPRTAEVLLADRNYDKRLANGEKRKRHITRRVIQNLFPLDYESQPPAELGVEVEGEEEEEEEGVGRKEEKREKREEMGSPGALERSGVTVLPPFSPPKAPSKIRAGSSKDTSSTTKKNTAPTPAQPSADSACVPPANLPASLPAQGLDRENQPRYWTRHQQKLLAKRKQQMVLAAFKLGEKKLQGDGDERREGVRQVPTRGRPSLGGDGAGAEGSGTREGGEDGESVPSPSAHLERRQGSLRAPPRLR